MERSKHVTWAIRGRSGGGEERDVGEGGELGGRDHSRQIFVGVEDTKKNLGLADHSRCIWVVGKG